MGFCPRGAPQTSADRWLLDFYALFDKREAQHAKSVSPSFSQVRVPVNPVSLSGAVTACEGMGQWEMALHLFFQNRLLLSCIVRK